MIPSCLSVRQVFIRPEDRLQFFDGDGFIKCAQDIVHAADYITNMRDLSQQHDKTLDSVTCNGITCPDRV
jgi:hypothetical protein